MSTFDEPMARGRLPETPPCPFCAGTETELMSAFGSQLSVATYWCTPCRSPFEFMKWLARDSGVDDEGTRPSPDRLAEGG